MNFRFRLIALLSSMCCAVTMAAATEHERPVVATYELQTNRAADSGTAPSPLRWHLKRSERCVVASDDQGRVSERWERDDQGRIWYRRIFHNEKKVIEYQPADLRLAGVEGHWTRIRSIIDPEELRNMKLQSEVDAFQGEAVSVYRGELAGAVAEIRWLAAALLPVQSVSEKHGVTSSIKLVRLERIDDASAVCTAPPADYETIDFADIGDKHGDPFIEGLMRYEGFTHGHR